MITLQVQPRVCGEYLHNSLLMILYPGSTPRMRGISESLAHVKEVLRFNPAYAGNIRSCSRILCREEVQPRVCGEYSCKINIADISSGSTPRMRGIFIASDKSIKINRFNPAYAGNISMSCPVASP